MERPNLTPRLVVRGAAAALDWYAKALDAKELERFATPEGKIVHSAIEVRGCVLAVIDEALDWGNPSPAELGGSPILLHLVVDDADALAKTMTEHGAEVVIPIDDRFYGYREGRLRDPFGHLWILSHKLRDMSDEEIQAGVDNFES